VPVTTTEQRITFKEVQLKQKSREPPLDSSLQESAGTFPDTLNKKSIIVVDRLTGKFVPEPTRAPRGKGKGKGRKGKQKVDEKAVDGEGKMDVAMAEQDEDAGPSDHDPMDIGPG
jgi:hypothetical protein